MNLKQSQLENAYANATFDYLENNEDNTYIGDYTEAIETTEDFLVNLDFNFYEDK